jgi:NADH dehydrogenase
VPNTAGRSPAPTTAQFATREAPLAADNIAAACKNRQTRSFGFGGLGTIATTGCQRGVANVKGVPVSGFPAWLLWRAFYLMQMPTLSRKLRIYVAWTWDMFFPRDVAQLSFAASQTVDQPASAPFSGEIPEGTERHAAE